MNITFKQLRIFLAVAERGSVVRAAAALHLTPPAVSVQIKEVEKQVGLTLFSRDKRRLSLSLAGEQFLGHAKRLLAYLKETDNDMARLRRLDHGTLTIGIVSTGEYLVPRLLVRFRADHPGIDVKIRVASDREHLIALMEAAEVDLSVMGRPPRDPAARAERFAAHPYVFVCPAQHPLLDSVAVSARALNGCPLIVREEGSGTRLTMERFLVEHRCTPNISMEIASNETIKQAVMVGMGLSFLPLHCIRLELRNGLLGVLDIEDTPVMGMLNLTHLHSRILSPAAEAFRLFIREQAEKDLGADDVTALSLAFKRKLTTRGRSRKSGVSSRRRQA